MKTLVETMIGNKSGSWVARVLLPNRRVQEIRVVASSYNNAREMIELQYGKNSLYWGPVSAGN